MNVTHELEPNEYGDIIGTVRYKKWRLTRSGEIVMWGCGVVFFDIVDGTGKNYHVEIGESVNWDTFGREIYALLTPGAVDPDGSYEVSPATVVGMAMGDVNRKMTPASSPDVTAVKAETFEDVEPMKGKA